MEFTLPIVSLICGLFFIVAFLYSSVGHGGASGYLAVMSLFAFAPKEMSTTALLLNILVAGISFAWYYRSGYFSLHLTAPFLIASIPMAFAGGIIPISGISYKILLSGALFVAATRLIIRIEPLELSHDKFRGLNLPAALFTGGVIGLLSGIVGIGGGIFLSPLLLLMRWADARQTAATSACFIVLNSISGISGRVIQSNFAVGKLLPFIGVAVLGGVLGSHWGTQKFSTLMLRRILGIVLIIAGVKLIVSGLSS